jgi:hypothetical protein
VRHSLRVGTILFICACAHRDPVAPATGLAAGPASAEIEASAGRLRAVRLEVDQLLSAEERWLWGVWTKGSSPDPGPDRAGHDALFSTETLRFVAAERDRASGDERRALSLLHAYLVGERLSRMTAASAAAVVGPAAIRWNGRTLSPARARAALAEEPDAGRRAALEHAWRVAEDRRAKDVNAYWDEVASAARDLGYPSLLALATELRGEPTEALAALAEGVLSTTEATYRGLVGHLAEREIGRPLAHVRGGDLPRLFRAGDDPSAPPPSHVAREAVAAFAAFGLDPRRLGVNLDLDPRPGKDPRALAFPIEVPGDVRVSFAPAGTPGELRALLHELGAAAFYARAAAPTLEFRRLGNVTVTAWATLFEDLASEPAWLTERTGRTLSEIAPMVCAAAARRLHGVRSLAARVLVEIARERGGGAKARAILERAAARPVDDDELQLFLAAREPLLESADSLRAALLAAQAWAFLAGRSAKTWWTDPGSGQWLASAFADGSRLDARALSRTLGAPALDAAALDVLARARAGAAGVKVAEPRAMAP